MKKFVPTILLLAACSSEVPTTFAEPQLELQRLYQATGGDCHRERPEYWFCTADGGFFHVFTARPAGAAVQVDAVMVEQGASEKLEKALLTLYGFTVDERRQLEFERPVRKGGFELALDARWKQPVIRAGSPD